MFFAAGTRVTSRPPHRSVRAQFGHTACMGLSLSRGVTRFWSSFAFHSFVRPAPRAFFRPDRIFPSPSRAAAVKDLLQRRRRLVLDGRERVVGRAMIRGEPAIGRDQSREPRLYSVEPIWGPDQEAVVRFCGQGSEAAGPFSQRHCSHSRMRIAATSDRHRLPRRIKCSQVPNPVCPFSF
jgi:hypothetical protein